MDCPVPSNPSDFEKEFDPLQYTIRYFGTPPPANKLRTLILNNLHKVYDEIIPDTEGLKILDYGSGPVVAYDISAAGRNVSEIVLSDFSSRNREALKQWIEKKSLFDWKSYFKYVVQELEGKSDQEVVDREERLRSLSKIVSCDIRSDQPVEKGFEGPYDVLTTVLAIENVCREDDDFIQCVQRLSKLIKQDGYFILFVGIGKKSTAIYYDVGPTKIFYYAVSTDLVSKALEAGSFETVLTSHISMEEIVSDLSDTEAANIEAFPSSDELSYLFVCAKKKLS